MPDTFQNFVGGQWKPSQTGQTFDNENPAAKGSNLGFFQSSSPDDIDEAMKGGCNFPMGLVGRWRRH